jgi:cytochrome c oxidase assembly factor CtaG
MSEFRTFFEHSEMYEKGYDTISNAISKLDNAMDQIVANNLTQKKKNRFLENVKYNNIINKFQLINVIYAYHFSPLFNSN